MWGLLQLGIIINMKGELIKLDLHPSALSNICNCWPDLNLNDLN